MTAPAAPPAKKRSLPKKALLRFLLIPLLLGAAFAAMRFTPLADHLSVDSVLGLFDRLRQAWWAPLALIGSYVLLLPIGFPATPMMIAGAAVFGPVWGSVYNLIGTYLGGTATYFLGRALGRDFVAHFAGKRLKKIERTVARRGFWSLVGIRFLPLPFPLVNYTAALAGVRPAVFLLTTAIGMVPTITIWTFFYATLAQAATGQKPGMALYLQVAGALALLVLATAVPQIVNARKRKARRREILARRAARSSIN